MSDRRERTAVFTHVFPGGFPQRLEEPRGNPSGKKMVVDGLLREELEN